MKHKLLMALGFALVSFTVQAKVTQAEADTLKTTLAPVGAERAANKDGSIPKWEGGLTKAPACYGGPGKRLCNPFPEDKPKFTISKANVEQYKTKLSDGQKALFAKYGDTYKMNVYQTRRTGAFPQFVYDATYKNALNAEIGNGGETVLNAILGIPYPIPKSGNEVMWNHKLRYRGVGADRWNIQAAVTTGGGAGMASMLFSRM